ncbi:PEPxxWA-CTERM sorting domain-containing protein [Novosphingobium sp. ES2-1]|uniref:PEPxxWA-CTERM sorting domain-containing protein n=1 Tax=Novosphingobium sp. ES2-1 TaxID=2780074 RepID=UPI001E5E90A6|nr:PEPxxWA-CTERM sorting domain-containing protein [Novosphingobium sp. ES2-1]
MRFKVLLAVAAILAPIPAGAATFVSTLEPSDPTALIGTAGNQTVIARVVFDRPATGFLDWRASYNRIDCVKATGYCETRISHNDGGGILNFDDSRVVYYRLTGFSRQYTLTTVKYKSSYGPLTLHVPNLTAPLGYNASLNFFGVPEPSTWAMMILGIGLAGGALRRQRLNSKPIPKPA